jgi:Tol biopolymer transport system component
MSKEIDFFRGGTLMRKLQSTFGTLVLLSLFCISLIGGHALAQQQTSSLHPYASVRPMPEPVLFGEGLISTAEDELNAAFSPDGKSLYFCKNAPVNRQGVIVVSNFVKGKWSKPEVVPFSGQYSDYDPIFSHDGAKLFFVSNRPLTGTGAPKKDYDIWVVEKRENGWSAPVNLGAPVNSDTDEFYPSVATDGTIYFSSVRPGGKGSFDLQRSRFVDGKYTAPENLGEANSQSAEIDSFVAPDQSFIIFASYGRPDDMGRGDLYISYQRNGVWSKAVNLGAPINSNAREYCPIGSPDGKYFFFTSFRGFADKPPAKPYSFAELENNLKGVRNGMGNIYQIDMSALMRVKVPE